jgi:hypothetical protein
MHYVGFEILTALVVKSTIFWDITLCSLMDVYWCVGGMRCFHLQGPRLSQASKQQYRGSEQNEVVHGGISQKKMCFLVFNEWGSMFEEVDVV